MPILDPQQQYFFISRNLTGNDASDCALFYQEFLKYASELFTQKLISIQNYIEFVNCFLGSIDLIKAQFKLAIPSKERLKNKEIYDYFDYFYKLLYKQNNNHYGNRFYTKSKTNLYLFEVCPKFTGEKFIFRHCWYFSDSRIAILHIKKIQDDSLINFEISLMKSLGLSIVLVFSNDIISEDKSKIIDLIKKKYFSEIHITFNSPFGMDEYNEILSPSNCLNKCNFYGFFYLYISTAKYDYKKNYKKNPYCTEIIFSLDLNICLGQGISSAKTDFLISSFNSKKRYIKVTLCEIPLYEKKYEEDNLAPLEISTIVNCFVEQDDFLYNKGTRVEVLFKDNSIKYVNFNDLHLIKPELFVSNMLHLMKTDLKTFNKDLQKIKVKKDEYTSKNNDIKSGNLKQFFGDQKDKITNVLSYLTYAIKHVQDIDLYDNQIFTVFESCVSSILNDISEKKGTVYQIETGEGKSLIIRMISLLLIARYDYSLIKKKGKYPKNVHIASSNIYLSKRDYSNSYDLFKSFDYESAVLLHQKELEADKFNGDKDIKKYTFNTEYYRPECFKNELDMNFISCGVGNDFRERQSKSPRIVFSTLVNLEAFYLKLIENWNETEVNEYFSQCSLIIDEADSILIDDLTNGTILSRPVKSNQNGILKFVYEAKMGKLSSFNLRRLTNIYKLDLENRKTKNAFIKDLEKNYQKNEYDRNANSIQNQNAENLLNILYFTSKGKLKKEHVTEFIVKLWSKNDLNELLTIYKNIIKQNKEKFKSEKFQVNFKNYIKLMIFICQTKTGNLDIDNLLEIIKKIWPNSNDLNEKALNRMLKEIELVHTDEFTDGKKYSIKEIKKEDKSKNKSKISKVIHFVDTVKSMYINKTKPDEKDEENKEEEEEEKEEEEEVLDESLTKYEVIPFDYDNKGILERTKEFSGFIQQFIAIKEMINNPKKYSNKIKIKEMSLNYSFISHPILVKLYKYIYGFTGTIGNKNDKQILENQYGLSAIKIPRNLPNRRVELPIILCSDLAERNKKILDEVLYFHSLNKPVLVILQDLNEINSFKKLFSKFSEKEIQYVNIFDNNEENQNPERIAGSNGEVSFGTNFCGRGTDIKNDDKPLHIIVTYYTRNIRVIKQAFGRTAREGKVGTCRIICLINEYLKPIEKRNNESISQFIKEVPLKLKYQLCYQSKYKFLYDLKSKAPKIKLNDALALDSDININRMTSFTFKYPIGMSVDTFLSIQTQKIFSIYNCPNSKYTWQLFMRYVREMVLESWAIKINELEIESKDSDEYELTKTITNLNEQLSKYFPEKETNIFKIFTNIYNIVYKKWKPNIDVLFQKACEQITPFKLTHLNSTVKVSRLFKFRFGFYPYTLIDESGSRINCFDGSTNEYIFDPEISYIYKKTKKTVSITEKIDKLFNEICKRIDGVIGGNTGLRFFLRRTLGGCEFGICADFCYEVEENSLKNCLFDTDPLLVFTIQTKSSVPILAGILIIVLVYTAKICDLISGGLASFIKKIKEIFKTGVKVVICNIFKVLADKEESKIIDEISYKINEKLSNYLQQQINIMKLYDKESKVANILIFISKLFDRFDYSKFNEESVQKLGFKFKIKESIKNHLDTFLPHLLKTTINIFLCIVAFFMNFKFQKSIKNKESKMQYNDEECDEEEAKKFNKEQNVDESYAKNKKRIPFP